MPTPPSVLAQALQYYTAPGAAIPQNMTGGQYTAPPPLPSNWTDFAAPLPPVYQGPSVVPTEPPQPPPPPPPPTPPPGPGPKPPPIKGGGISGTLEPVSAAEPALTPTTKFVRTYSTPNVQQLVKR